MNIYKGINWITRFTTPLIPTRCARLFYEINWNQLFNKLAAYLLAEKGSFTSNESFLPLIKKSNENNNDLKLMFLRFVSMFFSLKRLRKYERISTFFQESQQGILYILGFPKYYVNWAYKPSYYCKCSNSLHYVYVVYFHLHVNKPFVFSFREIEIWLFQTLALYI